ncbi:uncharacterized protein CcaverHIS019_0206620 [Cutaneotrichosporon cavernicola]|uniref:JmjC domain-containing protein n=1 Tax=Cutaneotrichosporon cavernicola TaxID=279322 RepID=A0AA48L1A5_9TREE|nr:uncharacterized protein CcaverHIS019_0206620 [Cutaneotrichosporon cavernicola]BEI89300.1 hypothetical protein CcaverHIS019_0206620 [Cutaneotrichosporon cavernicola]BEI97076.1 hypothetical protein CcaverHIS631_0206650 [Cutaneotrichosporon cavernicola]BEJ04849.1 hypothetical protein CcaverHIS641_0206660 [Cutaneotrichosporon cavernicola]
MSGAAQAVHPPTYDDLPYQRFLHDHLIPNTPFLLSPRATERWGARRDWVRPHSPQSGLLASLGEEEMGTLLSGLVPRNPSSPSNLPSSPTNPLSPSAPSFAAPSPPALSLPNFAALADYGDQVVPVADTAQREFSEFARDERRLREVLELWESGEGRTLYVKDWHLVAELGGGADARGVYEPPSCFLDDWLSPPFDAPTSSSASTADFRFVYTGPAGTFTPLHRDVYGSYSWSANIVGRKLWWLFPPGTEPRDKHGELLFDVRDAKALKVLQEEGEVIFVPSGWHHQVLNLDFCISINHNFFSSPTLPRVYASLRASHDRCAASIADVLPDIKARLGNTMLPDGTRAWEAEWAEEVDGLLARDAGWGWEGFWMCVRDDLVHPPTGSDLRPGDDEVARFVGTVLEQYKASAEWRLLPAARAVAVEVEALLASRA